MLFDPFEEEFDLPAIFVDEGDVKSREPKFIGEKLIGFVVFIVVICHETQIVRIAFLRFIKGKSDRLIGEHAIPEYLSLLAMNAENMSSFFESYHKMMAGIFDLPKQRIVIVSTVKNENRSFGE